MEGFYEAAVHYTGRSSVARLRFFLEGLLDGIPFEGRRVLDVGGGHGILTMYAAARGATEAVCLEPLAEGSRENTDQEFNDFRDSLGLTNARLSRERLQDYEPGDGGFDVVLLHNSVNHLDEQACVHLLEREEAREAYRAIFQSLADLANPGAYLLIADCARSNLFPRLGLKNPFARTIEWDKHQNPEVWIRLLTEAGFSRPSVRWSTFNSLRGVGRVLLGNRFAAYLLMSHFRLRMRRP